jgi:DNA-binding response OmpR family regulator
MDNKANRILAVDDDEFILEIIKVTLEAEGFTVTTVNNGQEALRSLKESKPDLILLDIRMPGLNGYETLNGIRKESEIPVIMLTGIAGPESLSWTLELGANDYIKKPFLPRELVARVRAKLRRFNLTG